MSVTEEPPLALAYTRPPTVDLDDERIESHGLALRRDALTAAGCWKVFTDHVSGTRERRPELDRLLEQVRAADTVVV